MRFEVEPAIVARDRYSAQIPLALSEVFEHSDVTPTSPLDESERAVAVEIRRPTQHAIDLGAQERSAVALTKNELERSASGGARESGGDAPALRLLRAMLGERAIVFEALDIGVGDIFAGKSADRREREINVHCDHHAEKRDEPSQDMPAAQDEMIRP